MNIRRDMALLPGDSTATPWTHEIDHQTYVRPVRSGRWSLFLIPDWEGVRVLYLEVRSQVVRPDIHQHPKIRTEGL